MLYWIFLLIAMIVYGAYCHVGYLPEFKISVWFTPFCLLMVLIGNMLWITFVKTTHNTENIFISGVIWDAALTASFVLVPMLFHNVQLEFAEKVGLVICLIGLFLMKGGLKLIGGLL